MAAASTSKVAPQIQLPRSLANKARTASPSTGIDKGQSIARSQDYLNSAVAALRASTRTSNVIRQLYHKDGTVSAGVVSLVQVANSGFRIGAYDRITGRFDPKGTEVVMAIAQSMDTLFDYSQGFSSKPTLANCVSTALKEVVIDGALAGELVLNKFRLPEKIQLVPYQTLTMVSDGKGGHYPQQESSGSDPIDLNIPNFFVCDLLRDTDRTYADSFLEAAANASIYYNEFIEDMRRVVRQAGHSRIVATLVTEDLIEAAKQAGITDPKEIKDFLESVQQDVTEMLQGLEPEEALVSFDNVKFDAIKAEKDKSDYTQIMQAVANIAATALKSSPSILGMRGTGSQSLSNTESLVFLKIAKAIQLPVEDFFSRALTLATRLFGLDVYCKFKFNEINLRPEDELSAYRSMQEDRILRKLSMGLISDEEAAWMMGNFPLPQGYQMLSGTGFVVGKLETGSTRDNQDKKGPNESAAEADTPTSSGGRDNKNRKDTNGS